MKPFLLQRPILETVARRRNQRDPDIVCRLEITLYDLWNLCPQAVVDIQDCISNETFLNQLMEDFQITG